MVIIAAQELVLLAWSVAILLVTGVQAPHRDRQGRQPNHGLILSADIQDRDAAPDLVEHCRNAYPTLDRCFAGGGYAGQKRAVAIAHIDRFVIEIVRRSHATASSSCPDAGSSSPPSHGSTDVDASRR